SCVPHVVCASSNGCVTKHKNQNHDHCFNVARLSQSESSQPENNPKTTAKMMECVKPRCISKAVTVSVKLLANTSKSGIVPAMALKSIALLPIFFPKTASPTAAPKTICVTESILKFNQQSAFFLAEMMRSYFGKF